VTGTKAQRDAVISAIQDLRAAVSNIPGFSAASVNAALSTDDARYEFVINEKFTNTESSSVVIGTPLANDKIADRYDRAGQRRLEAGLSFHAMQSFKSNATIGPLVDQREEALKKALLNLYNALDAQLKTIANLKSGGIPGASPNPKPPSVTDFDPLLSPPLDIS